MVSTRSASRTGRVSHQPVLRRPSQSNLGAVITVPPMSGESSGTSAGFRAARKAVACQPVRPGPCGVACGAVPPVTAPQSRGDRSR